MYALVMMSLLITPSYALREKNAMAELTRLNGVIEGHLLSGNFEAAQATAKEASDLVTYAELDETDNGEARVYGFSTLRKAKKKQAQQMTKALSFAVNLGSYQQTLPTNTHHRHVNAIVALAEEINPMRIVQESVEPFRKQIFDAAQAKAKPEDKRGYQPNSYKPYQLYTLNFDDPNQRRKSDDVRQVVFFQTWKILDIGRYIRSDGTIVLAPNQQELPENLKALKALPNTVITPFIPSDDPEPQIYLKGLPQQEWPKFQNTTIEVWNADSLDAYHALTKEDKQKTVVVDFAHATSIGGGAPTGSRAQEEQICYRTNLYQKLYQAYEDKSKPYQKVKGQRRGLNRDLSLLAKLDPKKGSDSGLYVPQITIFRSNGLIPATRAGLTPQETQAISSRYPYPYALHAPMAGPAMIVSAALDLKAHPKYRKLFWHQAINAEGKVEWEGALTSQEREQRYRTEPTYKALMDEYRTVTKHQIRFQFRSALKNRKTILIDGAFGDGAFINRADETSWLMYEVLEEPEFQNAFERVIFANLVNSNLDKPNYDEFVDVFSRHPGFVRQAGQ